MLHTLAATTMAYGWNNLENLVQDTWIREQKGGHMQFLTIQGLVVAWLTMVFSLAADLFPHIRAARIIKRALFMIAMPLSVVVTSIYWSLLFFAPHLLLQGEPGEPSSSSKVPEVIRLPLQMDLALHAVPAVSLLVDFFLFEHRYARTEAQYGASLVAAISGLWYAAWVEYCAAHNGSFPYPFLTDNPFPIRVAIYVGATFLALVSFWVINAIRPAQPLVGTATAERTKKNRVE
ncbi:hypothetical protein JAAARDRAFT_125221 [Jaapia argillacea MUCL 33604]|uniref:FAR-17a/AIG1-like protein n=1 Tax=Jaapia argillacea MUCL 33604 TaxID=933084 RepID=A0A067Q179_9AGAM|nr:hypothetical protein JAAARDRAFT_125221 [Jaapia argillacea MUCL 33604]